MKNSPGDLLKINPEDMFLFFFAWALLRQIHWVILERGWVQGENKVQKYELNFEQKIQQLQQNALKHRCTSSYLNFSVFLLRRKT